MMDKKTMKKERDETLDELLCMGGRIISCARQGHYMAALFALDQIDDGKRDALYAGVALEIARGAYTEKGPKEFRELADRVIKYCTERSSYLERAQSKK